MHGVLWVAVGLALLLGCWLAFDGTWAFLTGDYVTPQAGEYAGQLGPWAKVVRLVGLDPRSPLVKGLHVLLGVTWLVAAVALAARQSWARGLLVGCAVASLWYVPVGTLIAVLELVLLFLPGLRARS